MIIQATGRTTVPRGVAKQSGKLDQLHKYGFYSKRDSRRRHSLAAKLVLHPKCDNGLNNSTKGSKRLILSWTLCERRPESYIFTWPEWCFFLNDHLLLTFYFPAQGHCPLPLPTGSFYIFANLDVEKNEDRMWSIKPSSCVSITSWLHPSLLGKTKSFLQALEGFWWASCQRTPLGLHSKECLGPQLEKCSVIWCPSLVAFPGATGHLYKENSKAETLPRN